MPPEIQTAQHYEKARSALSAYRKEVQHCGEATRKPFDVRATVDREILSRLQDRCSKEAGIPFDHLEEALEIYEFLTLSGPVLVTLVHASVEEGNVIRTHRYRKELGVIKEGRKWPPKPSFFGKPVPRRAVTVKGVNGRRYEGTLHAADKRLSLRRVARP